ncbi:MAG: nucleoside-diphosphate sugar epimerase/dehydratase [Opitutaceae bacterium]
MTGKSSSPGLPKAGCLASIASSTFMREKTKIVIFGAGKGGERALQVLRKKYQVVGFADSNPARHGTRLLGLPILAPSKLKDMGAEKIYIASQYAMEIYLQLLNDLKWEKERIEIVNDLILTGHYEKPWLGLTAIGVVALFLVALLVKLLLL